MVIAAKADCVFQNVSNSLSHLICFPIMEPRDYSLGCGRICFCPLKLSKLVTHLQQIKWCKNNAVLSQMQS